ncbi:MAG TPA: RNA polymerase sigma factor [Planctomycetota bacterium]|nr:RNA polymerase sigma factor [Planctomycetota bacterium]
MREATRTSLFLRYRDRSDGQALARLFDDLAGELGVVARHLAPTPGEAEDLVASTFLRAMSRRASYRADTPVAAWMHGILWREAAQARRRAARRPEPERLTARSVERPDDALEASELRERLEAALARLPRPTAEILHAHLFEQAGADELAARSGRTPGTVRSQLHRALVRLRRALPVGLAPLGGFVPLPADLSAARARVLDAARLQGTSFPISTVAASAAWMGVPLMTKTFWIATSTAALTFVCGWKLGAAAAPDAAQPSSASSARAVGLRPEARLDPSALVAESSADAPTPREPVESLAAESEPVPFDELLSYWRGRFAERPDDWRYGWGVAAEVARLDPELALEIMRGVWPELSVPVKEQVLKPFVFGDGHSAALGMLDLALRDSALSVQGRALTYLEWYAFEDFEEDYGAALAWMDTWRDVPVDEVLVANARAFVERLARLDGLALDEALRGFDLELRLKGGAVDPAQAMREAGIEGVLARALTADDSEVVRAALDWAGKVEAGEPWLRAQVLPLLRQPELAGAALRALERPECAWASEVVFDYLRDGIDDPQADLGAAARVLAAFGDPSAVGRLIALMQHDPGGRSTYDIGYWGLGRLTGVGYDESHDAAWWQRWWLVNQARFH